jgi:hypothetical protein
MVMTFFGNKKKSEGARQIPVQVAKKDTLRDLVPNDEKMYMALQTFLLGDPERQLPMLGNVDSLLARGDEDKATGNKWKARINYETAAKIEIYKNNKEDAEKFLRLAEALTESNEVNRAMLSTLLENMDRVMRFQSVLRSISSSDKMICFLS